MSMNSIDSIDSIAGLPLKVLRACAGEVVVLPYDDAQREVVALLEALGLVRHMLIDDQPTAIATEAGRELLLSLKP